MPAPPDLRPEARARIDYLISREWSFPEGHPLAALQGLRLGDYLLLVLLGPKNNVGSRYFQLHLVDNKGRLGDDLLALGLYNSGPFPAYNWIELTRYEPRQSFRGRSADLAAEGLDLPLLEALSVLVPAGGHIMVEYDSPSHEATRRILSLGFPPVTTPLGYLLFKAGARSYRDWYIPEGGREGPRKLQAFKPLNEDDRRQKAERLRAEIASLPDTDAPPWSEIAPRNAEAVAAALAAE